MRSVIILKISLLTLLFATRCAREIQLDLPDEPPKTVAVCHFTTGQPFQVKVSLSRPSYASGPPEYPALANVTVAKNGQFIDKLFYVSEGAYWQSRDTAFPGATYSLAVSIDGLPNIEAASSVPDHRPLAPVEVDWDNLRTVPWDSVHQALRVPLTLCALDLPEYDRFFAFNLRHEIEVFKIVNGQSVPDYTYEGSSAFLTDGRTLSLLRTIPEPVVLIDEQYWSDDRRTIQLDALIPFDPTDEKPRRIFVEWRTLSGEFYRYHLSLSRQGDNLPLSDPDAIYNNVIGGYGNFSGYSVTVETIELQF